MIIPQQELQSALPDQTHMLMALGEMKQQGQLPQGEPSSLQPVQPPRVSGRVRGNPIAHKVLRMR